MAFQKSVSPPPSLPPISMFTKSPTHVTSSLMPASPPNSNYKSLPILPKPHHQEVRSPPHYNSCSSPSSVSTPPTPDQQTLWILFNQFQQYRSAQEPSKEQRAYNPATNNTPLKPIQEKALSSEEVLAEKRKRNAGASARFRDRRKQRERELHEKCQALEKHTKDLEDALRRIDPNHPLLVPNTQVFSERESTSPPPQIHADQHTLFDRVGQLEQMMHRFRQEKETDNKYLRSLLVPVNSLSTKESPKQKHTSLEDDNANKRPRLSSEVD
ncbi:hypothetical protein CU098_012180 [Rhizopus stolonifer]|uniref:BZIP domain-containing protein n=1 Tax=Rhizopus stolonifer TaxID=4846 RepID=A0A367KQV8_RHIST|nr:hypothetical protein CU098_012180 [Rhizopus stolonifer]